MIKQGKIIAFEGGDGCGKSTCAQLLAQAIRKAGKTVQVYPIIESSPVGAIYKQNYVFQGVTPVREAAGMMTSVLDTLETVLKPMRSVIDYLILDRSLASFATYQLDVNGYEWARPMFEEALKNPDFTDYSTIWLEVDPEEALRRMTAGRDKLDLIESKGVPYQERIHAAYARTFNRYPVLAPKTVINTSSVDLSEIAEIFAEMVAGLESPVENT